MLKVLKKLKGREFDWQKHLPFAYALYMKIAEPRTIRILQFIIYGCLLYTGIGVLFYPPGSYSRVVSDGWIVAIGLFVTVGAIVGASAVLPGIWWLERVGVLLLGTGISMYVVVAIILGQSPLGIAVFIAFIMTFIQRWSEIRGSDLAPVVPREA